MKAGKSNMPKPMTVETAEILLKYFGYQLTKESGAKNGE
jgi:hypothetical protein